MTYSPLVLPRNRMSSTYGAIGRNDVERPAAPNRRPRFAGGLYMMLPVPLFCSMGMAATSSTTIFAYETLVCKDPSNCSSSEKKRYSATVATSVVIANFCAVLVLWVLPLLPRANPKNGLYFWIFARASSVLVLAAGVHYSSIWLAVSGRVLEGFATDNVLQLVLNTLYVRASEQTQVSRLFGLSLALFTVGQGLSPIISGSFADFRASFAMATLLFGLCFSYIWILPAACIPEEQSSSGMNSDRPQMKTTPATVLLQPLRAAVRTRALWGPEAALLLFLAATSYLYPAILVFASTRHGFTAAQNGWIVSLTAASCSCCLLAVHVVWPRLRPAPAADPVNNNKPRPSSRVDVNFRNAAASMLLLAAVCPAIGLTTRAWQVYVLAAVAALGLSAPAFVKSYAVGLLASCSSSSSDGDDDGRKTQALTALALMETCGALLSPVVLGVAAREDGSSVFFVAAALVVAALAVLTIGAVDFASGGGGGRLGRRRVARLRGAGAFLSVTDDASARLGTRADVLLEPEASGRVRAGWLSS